MDSTRMLGGERPPPCYHGGAFFEGVGPKFDDLGRRHGVINADVLDAWFDPAPGATEALRDHLPWLMRTSPPTHAEGFLAEVAAARGVPEAGLVAGAGSSDLIFRAFPRWLSRGSRALVLEPSYGEYAHVLEHVVGCRVDRLRLSRDDGFDLPADRLAEALRVGYDLVVLVNPNNPTGRFTAPEAIAPVLAQAPPQTRVWVDEAYVDYAGPGGSLERFACGRDNVVVCKTMSKVYALSGLRAAYLCADPLTAAALRAVTPPWVVGLPAQVSAVHALRDPAYYAGRYRLTHELREGLAADLGRATEDRLRFIPSRTNALLGFLPEGGPESSRLVAGCRSLGLFLRDPGLTCPGLGRHALRFAVKDEATNRRIVDLFGRVYRETAGPA